MGANVIYAGQITTEQITAGVLEGMIINWAGRGQLRQGRGHDGENETDVVYVESSQGLVLSAQGGGVRVQGSTGVFLMGNRVQVNGSDIVTNDDLFWLRSQVEALESRVAELESQV